MIRHALLAVFLLSFSDVVFGQPEESAVFCTVQLECADDPGTIIDESSGMNNGCAQCYAEHVAQLKLEHPSGLSPCSEGVAMVFRMKKCEPYHPFPTAALGGAMTTTYTVKLDYLFSTGDRFGPEATGATFEIAFASAMNQLCELAESNLFGQVCAGTGRCFFNTSCDSTFRRCSAPRCPTRITPAPISAPCVVRHCHVSACQPSCSVPVQCCQPTTSRRRLLFHR